LRSEFNLSSHPKEIERMNDNFNVTSSFLLMAATEILKQCGAGVHERLRIDVHFVDEILLLARAKDLYCDRLLVDETLPNRSVSVQM
jgi:hypothetical protein